MILYRKLHKLISMKWGGRFRFDILGIRTISVWFKGFGRVHDLQNDLTAVMMPGPIVSQFL